MHMHIVGYRRPHVGDCCALIARNDKPLSRKIRCGLLQSLVIAALGLAFTSISVASASACQNETLRSELHSAHLTDCRAYELVSPVAKYGQPVEASYVSSSGVRALGVSIGTFSGSDQTSPFNYYMLAREATDWGGTPLNTPAGYFNPAAVGVLAASPDLRNGLFNYTQLGAADPRDHRYYIHELPTGLPVEIGPLFPEVSLESNPATLEPNFSGPSTSRDLSHVVFMIEGPTLVRGPLVDYVWPGDTTAVTNGQGFVSLYEYAGTGNSAPSLVGIDNAGHLISQCGTSLGFPIGGLFTRLQSSEIYNAVSVDGSRVFFAAAGPCEVGSGPSTDELYARINGEKTVAISEPSHPLRQGSGSGPEECDSLCEAATHQAGVFQGASEDGSKVFFLTAQPLLNGDEDTETDLYEAEIEGGASANVRRLIQVSHDPNVGQASEVQGVSRVSEDGSHVYFVAKGKLTNAPNPVGDIAQRGAANLYVYERDASYPEGHTAYIATLSATDGGDWALRDLRPIDATPTGRFLVFMSSADLTPGDTSSQPQVFEYDAQTTTLVRVSHAQSGFDSGRSDGDFAATIQQPNYSENLNPARPTRAVSEDGSYVVFQSKAALTPQASVGHNNVYEYHNDRVSLVSDGQGPAFLAGMDASGADIFFTTVDSLVPQDGDTQEDLYDARIGGGFVPPLGPAVCEDVGCRGALAPSPLFASGGGSASQPAGEQVIEPPAKPATKTKRKRKVRRAKRKTKKTPHRTSQSASRGRRR